MRHTVKLPRLSDTGAEVVVLAVGVAVGDDVAVDDVLIEVETDKATAEVPAPVAGRVREVLVALDDELSVGAALVVLESP